MHANLLAGHRVSAPFSLFPHVISFYLPDNLSFIIFSSIKTFIAFSEFTGQRQQILHSKVIPENCKVIAGKADSYVCFLKKFCSNFKTLIYINFLILKLIFASSCRGGVEFFFPMVCIFSLFRIYHISVVTHLILKNPNNLGHEVIVFFFTKKEITHNTLH